MSILEPCASCTHAGDKTDSGYLCKARGFHLHDDVVIYPKLCTFFEKKED